jgi:TolB protein
MYSATREGEGIKYTPGPSTLFLVSAQGSKYQLGTWSASNPRANWYLLGWSGDVSRALFVTPPVVTNSGAHEHVDQLELRTGHVSGFTLPPDVTAVGYTRPDGLNILAERTLASGSITLQRYSLTGKLLKDLATVKGLGLVGGWNGIPPAPYNPKGTELAGGTANGVELISNAGGAIRKLPVPNVTQGCAAVRWWTPTTILASCGVTNEPGPRMWLVPESGARPTALTPVRAGSNPFDLGDFNAWQLSSGLYVNGYGGCSTLVIGRQPAHGNEQQITVPGSASSLIVNATRSTLMVERFNACTPGTSLVVFNPATRKMTVAIPVRRHQAGVSEVVPIIAGKF